MSITRIMVKLFLSVGRNLIKRCSYRSTSVIVGAILLVWSGYIFVNSSEFQNRIYKVQSVDNFTRNGQQGARKKSIVMSSKSESYFYDDLVQDNPLGTYFSDKLSGTIPVGISYLEFSRIERDKRLQIVLILLQNVSAPSVSAFAEFFAQQRIQYRFRSIDKELPSLVFDDIGVPRYSLIVFGEFVTYLNMESTRRAVLDTYCKTYNIGVLAILQSTQDRTINVFSDRKLTVRYRGKLKKFILNPESDIWRVAKPDEMYLEPLPSSDWTVFKTDHETYKSLVFSTFDNDPKDLKKDSDADYRCVIAVHDQGLMDGIQRILLGYGLDFWLNSIVAVDAITYLTGGLFGQPLTRLLQVDIDDMFVGASGIRTLVKDAKAIVASQERIRRHVPGFTYKLGFSGEYFKKGNLEEQAGDEAIVELAHNFVWFDHLHRHDRLLNFNRSGLTASMTKNAMFAKFHNLPMSREYMVPPYHAGVYPVYEPLYDEWNARGMICTSTMEYPKESPVWGRRGFIYRGVMILPRIDCNLYTTVNKFEDFVGGKAGLDKSIRGDLLFKMFLQTPVLIFMTHMSNYANDQLGQYLFENVVEFVTRWTNLKLTTATPTEIGRRYFEMYPRETIPIWTNPCEFNSNHLEILPPHVKCSKFPKLFILEPHQPGTGSIAKFLEVHPMMVGAPDNAVNESHQFFSSGAYQNGLDWYQNQFPEPDSEGVLLFEASQNYFHDKDSPKRIAALVPKAKVVIVLDEPTAGVYNCYQNLIRFTKAAVRNYTLFEAVSGQKTAPQLQRDIQNKCLKSRAYAVHLARWLQFFSREQIHLVDGDELGQNLIAVLNQIQSFSNVVPYEDLSIKLKYDSTKRCFYRMNGKCLRPVREKTRPILDDKSRQFLEEYFKDHNSNLKILLKYIEQKYPTWLLEPSQYFDKN